MRLDLHDQVQHAQDITRREALRALGEFFLQSLGHVRERAAQHHGELRAQEIREIREEDREIDPEIGESRDGGEYIPGPALDDDVEQRQMLVLVHEPERLAHALGGDPAAAERQHLVRERERVAHGAVGGAREHRERVGIGLDALGREHGGQAHAHVGRPDATQIEALHPREDRRGGLLDLLRFGGGEHEHHARRRLLEDLEECVPRLAREHVRFVDDIDLVPVLARRRVHRALAQLTGVVHTTVGRRIDLHDVERRSTTPDPGARRALPARLAILAALLAVERHREHPRERRLPCAAGPAEQIRVRDAVAGDGIAQRVGHVRLHGDLGELARAVLPGEGERHPRKLAPPSVWCDSAQVPCRTAEFTTKSRRARMASLASRSRAQFPQFGEAHPRPPMRVAGSELFVSSW